MFHDLAILNELGAELPAGKTLQYVDLDWKVKGSRLYTDDQIPVDQWATVRTGGELMSLSPYEREPVQNIHLHAIAQMVQMRMYDPSLSASLYARHLYGGRLVMFTVPGPEVQGLPTSAWHGSVVYCNRTKLDRIGIFPVILMPGNVILRVTGGDDLLDTDIDFFSIYKADPLGFAPKFLERVEEYKRLAETAVVTYERQLASLHESCPDDEPSDEHARQWWLELFQDAYGKMSADPRQQGERRLWNKAERAIEQMSEDYSHRPRSMFCAVWSYLKWLHGREFRGKDASEKTQSRLSTLLFGADMGMTYDILQKAQKLILTGV